MKQLLKNILPPSLLYRATGLRDQIKLAATPAQNFDHTALNSTLTAVQLQGFFNNVDVDADWQATVEKIKKLYVQTKPGGGVNPGDRRALYYLIRALRPQNMLEVGTHIGASTVYIAEALKAAQAQTGMPAHLTTVDILDVNAADAPWRQQDLAHSPRGFLEAFGTSDLVTFTAMRSSEFLDSTTEKFDFIFLDGDHGSRTVYEEVSKALRVLSPGGVILLHDYYPAARAIFNDGTIIAGPFLALDRIMRENNKIAVLPLGELPWPTKNGLNITSLALITRPS
ncbi:MAG TPA: class I SAM-dependent methyltransferase [Micavibrio sp.]